MNETVGWGRRWLSQWTGWHCKGTDGWWSAGYDNGIWIWLVIGVMLAILLAVVFDKRPQK